MRLFSSACFVASLAVAAILSTSPAAAQDDETDAKEAAKQTPEQVLASAPGDQWLPIAVSDLLIMTLPKAADGSSREIIIQLLPKEFAQGHVNNVHKLAKAGWFNRTVIYRVQPKFVTQFGGGTVGKRPLRSLVKPPESEYYYPSMLPRRDRDMAALKEQVDYSNQYKGTKIKPLKEMIWEPYQAKVGFGAGWPIGSKGGKAYPLMCKGSLSPAHGPSPDTGDGTEISIMTGTNGRGLDAEFANVGRVIEGLEHAINLPAGPGAQGFFKNKADMTPVVSITPAINLPADKQPRFEYLASHSPYLMQYIEARGTNKTICDHPVPIRRKKA